VSSKLAVSASLTYQGFALSSMYIGLVIGALLGTTLILFVALAEMVCCLFSGQCNLLHKLKITITTAKTTKSKIQNKPQNSNN